MPERFSESDTILVSIFSHPTPQSPPGSLPLALLSTLEMAEEKVEGITYHDQMIIAHAVFASMATLITAPAAILVARYFRSRTWWFKAHLILQALTVALTVIFFTLSTVAVRSGGNGDQFTGPKKDPHHDLGLSVVVLLLVEAVFGVAAHLTRTEQSTHTHGTFPTLKAKKSPLRHLHAWYGVFVAGLLYAGMKTGMDEWDMVSDGHTFVPNGIQTAFWVIFSLEVAAYVVGWAKEAVPRRKVEPSDTMESEKAESTGSASI